ncbi:MAG TPA: hypothetical protein ENL22_06885 [candidate division Zixibacteria bacterium]|nr:hypothetical protein [candidate division Zixibacteria bacterium]
MVKKEKKRADEGFEWPFGPRNYILFAIGLLVIIVGYISLSAGSITLAPILLVLGYCVLIPISIIIKGKSEVTPADDVTAES